MPDIRYDPALSLEAYRFRGLHQTFPGHFHPYYFMGFIQSGRQLTTVHGVEREIGPETLLLFDPGVVHTCRPAGAEPLEYRCLNIPVDTMERWAAEVVGAPCRPLLPRSHPQRPSGPRPPGPPRPYSGRGARP